MEMDQAVNMALVRELEAHRRITDLVHRYALNVRNGTPLVCRELMAQDVVYTIYQRDPLAPPGEFTTRAKLFGIEDVLDYIQRSAGSGSRVFPIIHNLLIDLEGDTAISNCLMSSRVWPGDSSPFGQYDDRFAKIDGRWLFVERSFTMMASPV